LKNLNRNFGFDLDNTLIDYTISAKIYSKSNNLENCEDIKSLRSLLRTNDPTGYSWQKAQSWIYTEGLSFAYLNTGAIELCRYLDSKNFRLQIATQWLMDSDLSIYFANKESIHYESTRLSKVKKIRSLNLNYFVDDLIEVFTEYEYPKDIKSYLLGSYDVYIPWVKKISSLLEIMETIEYEF
jgi:hypothetical protein